MVSLFRIRRKERWIVALSPNALAAARQHVSGNGPATHLDELTPDVGGATWDAPLKALEDWIKNKGQWRLKLRIVLSNRFVRYTIVPWSNAATSRDDRQILTRIAFQQQYGLLSGWEIRVERGGCGKPQIVYALPKGLIVGLREVIDRVGVCCLSVDPFFSMCWNRCGNIAPESDSVIVVAERDGPTILATTRNGAWESIRNISGFQTIDSLVNIASREAILKQHNGRGGWLLLAGGSANSTSSSLHPDFLKQTTHRADHPVLDMALIAAA